MVAIGAVRRPHGVRGAVKVFSFSGEIAHFEGLSRVELRRKDKVWSANVEKVLLQGGVPLLWFSGVTTPEQARDLAGAEIWVPRDQAAPCGSNEYYITDLVGMTLLSGGDSCGEIIAVVDGLQAPLLEVKRETGTVLIPFMSQYVGDVDTEKRTVELLVPWLMDTE
ncbi:16S rRNA processing protein RimM [Alkalispirochaeta americana]|uniref:Ribosome maturation factor RimM n=2 Tax=Alkalispirochaeta americana TaxID=159291 RepID=A0A1N6X3K9_9SPIO|nr:16S rRNA processing protein RimM [Alkalispirochaeta americana]